LSNVFACFIVTFSLHFRATSLYIFIYCRLKGFIVNAKLPNSV
jgi:hypothetical protein